MVDGAGGAVRRARALIALSLLVPLLLAALLLLLSPPTRLAARTLALIPSFFASLPGTPLDWVSAAPRREVVELAPVDGYVRVHIYRPAGGRHPALVLSLGIDPAPPDDRRVVRLLDGLARSGLVAALVESEALNGDQLYPDLPQALVEGVQFTGAQPYVRADRIGLFGFSVGGSLALIAAGEPALQDRLRLVEAFGSYATLDDALLSVATHTLDDGGRVRPWQPATVAQRHLANALIGGIDDPDEAAALRSWLVDGTGPEPDPTTLSPEGRAIEALMNAPDRATGERLLGALPARAQEDFAALSPLAAVPRIHASLFVMYDADDPLLPYTGSQQICARASADGLRLYCSRFAIFRHVDPTRAGSPAALAHDLVELFLHAFAIMRRLQ